MIHSATKRIAAEFSEAGLKHQVQEIGPLSYTEMGFTGENCQFLLRFVSTDEDNDVKALTEDFVKIPAARMEKACKLLNELSRQYKYFKFTMGDDGGVSAQYDFPISTRDEDLGKFAVELALRCSKIVDDAFPKLMSFVWGRDE